MIRYKLSPSILAADFNKLGDQIKSVEKAGADYLHVDVMDGSFVPSISFGMPVIKSIRSSSRLFFDVHLMIVNPERYIRSFSQCGADGITFHLEAAKDVMRIISLIRDCGKRVGIAISPETPVSGLSDEVIEAVDMVLIMTVRPGFGGQTYLEECTDKIAEIRKRADSIKPDLDIEVDGGINKETIKTVLNAGANVIVMGSSVFGGNATENTEYFKKLLNDRNGKA